MELVFATHNDHKLKEIKEMMRDMPLEIKSLKELDFNDEIEETGTTMKANAFIKSDTIAQAMNCNVFSDDSGLEVIGLNMEPGVYTARYAGIEKNQEANMDLLIQNMKDITDRSARFRSCISLIWKGKPYFFDGIVNGRISFEKRGQGGFGYDPIFIPYGKEETFAELGETYKNSVSHRYRALIQMKAKLKELMGMDKNE